MTETATTMNAAEPAAEERDEFRPIADYGLLADCNSAALVSRDGSIDWLCMPRYDSPAVFSRILDPKAGHWSIRPSGRFDVERRYLPGTLVIETTFTTESGSVRLRDAMAFAEGQRGHDLGFDTPHEVLRSVEGVTGRVEMRMELAPRGEYGLVKPLFRQEDGGGRTFGGPDRVAVRASVPVDDRRRDDARLVRGGRGRAGRLRDALGAGRERRHPEPPTDAERVSERIDDVVEAWRSWEAEHDIYDGPAQGARSAELPGAEGADLPPDRRDRRRPDDLAAGDGRR